MFIGATVEGDKGTERKWHPQDIEERVWKSIFQVKRHGSPSVTVIVPGIWIGSLIADCG
jgi:hypothetical protein